MPPQDIKKIQKHLSEHTPALTPVCLALGDTTRFRIFHILKEYRTMNTGDIARVLNISASAVSQHIRVLTKAHLVETTKKGRSTTCRVNRKSTFARAFMRLLDKRERVH